MKVYLPNLGRIVSEDKPARLRILTGWKEIANYLHRGVRTVQRYERERALPNHRPAGKVLAGVVAIQTELDNWVTTSAKRKDSRPNRWSLNAQTNRLRANFLQIDCETALTFSSIALETRNEERRKSATQAARKAYDTIMHLREGTDLSDAERNKLEVNLMRLKSELQRLGESF